MKEREEALEILLKTHYESGYASELIKGLDGGEESQKEIAFVKTRLRCFGRKKCFGLFYPGVQRYSHWKNR